MGACSSEEARFLALGAGVLGREAREAGNCGGGIGGEPMRNCSGREFGRAGERGDESPGAAGGELRLAAFVERLLSCDASRAHDRQRHSTAFPLLTVRLSR